MNTVDLHLQDSTGESRELDKPARTLAVATFFWYVSLGKDGESTNVF